MGENEKLLSKKSSTSKNPYNQSTTSNRKQQQEQKLFSSKDDYGTLTKQYIVQDEYPKTHFSAFHCVIVSFVFVFCLVFITTSLLIGLPRVRQRYEELNGLNFFNATSAQLATNAHTTMI